MTRATISIIALFATAFSLTSATVLAADNPGERITRPAGYKPMAAKPLPWNSKELAGLTANLLEVQKTFKLSH